MTRAHLRGMIAFGAAPALGVLSGPILAHSLGPHGRGQFSAAMEPLTVAGAFATIGIPSAVTYFTARGFSRTTTRRIGLRLALIPTLATLCFMGWYSARVADTQNMPRWVLLFAWSFIGLSAVVQVVRGSWQGSAAWRRLDTERLLFGVLRFLAVAIVALLGVTTSTPYVLAALGAFAAASLILWLPRARATADPGPRPKSRAVLAYSLTASVGTITVVANNRIDQVLMPAQVASAEVGYYAVAVTIAEVPLVIAALAARNALQLSSAGANFKTILDELRVYLIAVVVLAAVLAGTASAYVPLLFGQGFEPSVTPVRILSLGSASAAITLVATACIAGRGRPALSSFIPLCGFAITGSAFVILWGAIGALDASIIATSSQMFSALTALIVVGRMRGNAHPPEVPAGNLA